MSLKSLLVFAALAASSQARAVEGGPLAKRIVCNADNALRNLRDSRYSSSASIFCSQFIQSTVTDTLFVTATSSETATETPEPNTVTISLTDTVTKTITTYPVEYPTAVNTFFKRGEIPYPTWLPATYPVSRVSSACSCFIASPSAPVVTTFTTTVATVTETATETLEPLTKTKTSLATVTVSTTRVIVQTGPQIPCGVKGCNTGIGFIHNLGSSTVTQCRDLCLSTPSCKLYQFSGPYYSCFLFSVLLHETYATGSSGAEVCAQFKFYDPRCIV
ncbi:hypothetical protein TWF718_009319 [Orbilia javanica]|uniref:Apple domain-containing protein n=1 Tax=Orbilia javanica TaxID=47235 RepID=A0AAN8MP95_9PEZI